LLLCWGRGEARFEEGRTDIYFKKLSLVSKYHDNVKAPVYDLECHSEPVT